MCEKMRIDEVFYFFVSKNKNFFFKKIEKIEKGITEEV